MSKVVRQLVVGVALLVTPCVVWAQSSGDAMDGREMDSGAARGRHDRGAAENEVSVADELNSGYTIKEQELEERRARLLAQESKLLEELHREPAVQHEPVQREPMQREAVQRELAPREVAPERRIPQDFAPAPQVDDSDDLVPFSAPADEQAEPIPVRVAPREPAREPVRRAPNAITSVADAQEIRVREQRKAVSTYENQLQNLKLRNQDLNRDLQETKDRLMIAETEVERLSRLLREKNTATLANFGATPMTAPRQPAARASLPPPPQVNVAKSTTRSAETEPLIATVMADKANLRTGPGRDNSPAMTVSRGTRLVVEKRVGEWYRVITPAGTRAWVASEVIAFGETSQASPSRTVRIRGYDASLEDETLKLINNSSR